MRKKLKVSGNGWVLYFTKPLLKLLGYNPAETKILITAKGNTLLLKAIEDKDTDEYKNNMVRKFQKNGCSYGLYFPGTLIEVLDIEPETDFLDIEINENIMLIKKAE